MSNWSSINDVTHLREQERRRTSDLCDDNLFGGGGADSIVS